MFTVWTIKQRTISHVYWDEVKISKVTNGIIGVGDSAKVYAVEKIMTISLDLLDEESATQAIQTVAEIAEENDARWALVSNLAMAVYGIV